MRTFAVYAATIATLCLTVFVSLTSGPCFADNPDTEAESTVQAWMPIWSLPAA